MYWNLISNIPDFCNMTHFTFKSDILSRWVKLLGEKTADTSVRVFFKRVRRLDKQEFYYYTLGKQGIHQSMCWSFTGMLRSDPPENCHFNAKKLPKTWKKIQIKLPKIYFFFQKNCHWQIFWKKWKFLEFFFEKHFKFLEKKIWKTFKVFGNFFTFKR